MSLYGGNGCAMVKIDKYFKFISSGQIIKIQPIKKFSKADNFVDISGESKIQQGAYL